MLNRRCFLLGSTAALAALPAAGAPLRFAPVIVGGTRTVAGPSAPIEIVDDQFGIPHIRAATIPDAFFGQGYVVARDRLFQIDLSYRRDLGRLAEFDALFIRETTAIDNHTYRFARRATQEGMPVIDDPIMMPQTDKPRAAEVEAVMVDIPVATDDPPSYPNPFGEGDNAALSDIVIPTGEAPPLVPEPGDGGVPPAAAASEPTPRKRRPLSRRKERPKFKPLPAIIFILICTVAAMFTWRKDIVRRAPQMASLYSALGMPINLRGLSFTDIKVTNDVYDGVPVIIVEGTVVSQANMAVDVPRIRFAVQNAAGHEVYSWTTVPSQPVLEPGERLAFKSRLASPPPDAHNIAVRFFTRRDAAAGLR